MCSLIFISTISIPAQFSAYTYPFSKSYYIQTTNSTTIYNKGYNLPNQAGIVILFFGCPEIRNGVYGTKMVGTSTFVSTTQIANVVNNFMNGYNANSSHTQLIKIAVATSNYQSSYAPTATTISTHGKNWVQMIEGITVSGKVTYIEGANDMELGWASPSYTKSWVNAFNSNRTKSTFLYNFGDNAGSYDIITPYGVYTSRYTDNRGFSPWTTSDVYDISYGISCCYAMPQIYYDTSTSGYANQPNQWYHVALWAYNNNKSMNFAGLVSQDGMSGQLTADAAYASFRNELSKDTRTAQSGFGYPTVLGY